MFKELVTATFVLLLAVVSAQAQTSNRDRAERLRTQLTELQAKQTELQGRLDELNEQLKPENIEKSLAGVGSTKPEDLRELRRRQLETEKSGIEKQLVILNDSRMKLESSIAQADALVYQQSPLPAASVEKVSASSSRPRQASRKRVRARRVNR
jgi:uncharacterized protein YlxW (UPF0749 family)